MSQQTNLTPLKYISPNGKYYCPEKNIELYNFQLKYSPLANHNNKNPGKFCYINDNKFGEVSGCSNETQQTNFTNNSIINKISNNNFTRRLFVYDKNYVSQPPYYNIDANLNLTEINKLKHFDTNNLYKSYVFNK